MLGAKRGQIVWSATPTPFLADGSVDEVAVQRLVEQHLWLETEGIFACGTCGEGPWMPDRRRVKLVSLLKKLAAGRIHISAQVTDTSAERVRENMRAMADAGADSVVIAPPLIHRMCAPGFLRRYYFEPIEAAPLPVGIYAFKPPNAPPMEMSLWREIASHPKIAYVKDSSASEEYLREFMSVKARRPELVAMTGNEFDVIAAVAAGYDGGLAGTGILVGGMLRRGLKALAGGDRKSADEWQERVRDLLFGLFRKDISRWMGGLKHALKYVGIFQNEFMHYDYPMTDQDRREVEAVVEKYREFIVPSRRGGS